LCARARKAQNRVNVGRGGNTSFLVQDLVIRRHVVDFRRERWLAAGGRMSGRARSPPPRSPT
jgi:hypothetical protein